MAYGDGSVGGSSWSSKVNSSERSRLTINEALLKLSQLLSELTFDLRANTFVDFHQSFGRAKREVESVLNDDSIAVEQRQRLVVAFNSEASRAGTMRSRDYCQFYVRAFLRHDGQIELEFMER